MLDSQKISFDEFLLGYKHGVYVITSDSCDICAKYKDTIEYINNAYLYFVDVVTKEQRDAVYKLTQRSAFPLTAVFWDNELDYVRLGQLFELQLTEIFESLKKYGDKPLSVEEKNRRLTALNSRCKLTYYVLPPNCDPDIKNRLFEKGYDFSELPIDVDSVCPGLPEDKRLHMLEGNFPFAKLVIYKDKDTNIFTQFAQKTIMAYTGRAKSVEFVIRNIEETLNAADNSDND